MMQVYNYLMESYQSKPVSKNHVHKKGELKKVYENIVKLNKNSAFYKINLTQENQLYTFGIKETALTLKSKISDMIEDDGAGFQQKTISLSDEKVLAMDLIKEDISGLPDTITMSVDRLASPQVNKGKDLFHPSRGFDRGVYDFRAYVMGKAYDLSFVQKEKESNLDTMRKLAEYLDKELPGLSVSVDEGKGPEYSHITLATDFTGRFGDKSFYFEDSEYYREGVIEFFGLNHTEKAANNSQFTINGVDKQTNSNTFLIEDTLKVTLKDISQKPVTLQVVPDSKPMLEQLDSVLASYNDFIRFVKERKEVTNEHLNANKLINELKGIEKTYEEELSSSGLIIEEDGTISRNTELSEQAAINGNLKAMFTKENGFIAKLLEKSENIAINPLEYLDKTIVTYPNNAKVVFANPYVTSRYSGLFFNSYC